MAREIPRPSARPRRRHLAWLWAVLLLLSGPSLDATSLRLFIVQYSLVAETPTADGTEYVFRGRLFNLGQAVPGTVARLTGSSSAATVLDDTLSFGPVERFGLVWSSDTAAIRRHGRWRDILLEFRWSFGLAGLNRPPTADAGPDQTVARLDRVVLDGSASSDPDGDALTYRWAFVTQPAGSTATLDDPASVGPAFVVDVPGRYVLALVVSDATQPSVADLVEVTTVNSAPVADAGPDQRLRLGAVAQLDGSGSSDADGDRLAFVWQFLQRPAGSAAVLDDPHAVRPTFPADAPGTYILRLVVSDGVASSAPDLVELTTDNTAPTADAGLDQHVAVGQTATLDGSGSTDVDGDPLTYAWALVAAPPGSTAALTAPASVTPRLTVDRPGQYVAQLVVHDGRIDSAPDTVLISTINTRPIADAGADVTAVAGQRVVLDGSASRDADGDALTFQWTLVSSPPGSAAALDDPAAAVTAIPVDLPGDYVLQLVVHDGQLDSAPDALIVSTINSAPLADAGPDIAGAALGTPVVLDGSASSDPDGHALRYTWALLSRPAGSLAVLTGANTPTPSFTPDVVGSYVAQLVVNDGFVDGAPDTVRVATANAPPVADAGPDQTVPAGASVQLDGRGSNDPEGAPLAYQWTILAQPGASTASLSDRTAATPIVLVDVPGQYTVQLVVDDGAQASAPDVVVITAVPPVVSVLATDPQAGERGPDEGLFTISRSGPVGLPLAVEFTVGGTAANGVDYQSLGTLATFAAGDADLAIRVVPLPDTDAEGDETVTLDLVPGAAYTLGAAAAASVVIADDPAPVVTVAASDPHASEWGDPGTVTVSRSGATAAPLTVTIAVDGTATAGADYQALPATVTIPSGAASAVVPVLPLDDAVFEASESVIVSLVPQPAYVVGTPSAAIVTLADDDTRVALVVTDSSAAEPGADTGAFTVSRVGATSGPLTVFYAVTGTASAADYAPLGGSVTFAAGDGSAAVIVRPIDDPLLEGPETVVLTLQPGPGYQLGLPDTATLTILDDERPAVTITVSDAAASEAGPDPGAFSIARTGPTTAPLDVAFSVTGAATEGVDYQSLGGHVTIPAGATSVPLSIVPIDDLAIEGAEQVVISIAPGPDYVPVTPAIAALSIADDDLGAVTIEATDASAAEAGLDPGTVLLRRSGDLTAPLTVRLGRGGSVSDTDYVAIGVFATFAAGDATLALPITPRADNLVEGVEALTISVLPDPSYVVGSPASATVTIADDAAVITLVASSPAAAEANRVAGAFALTRAGGDPGAAMSVAVTIGGTAGPNVDYGVLSGVVSFPAGQTTVVIPVVPLADNVVEPDETVTMTVAPGSGTVYLIGAPSSAAVTIADDPVVVELFAIDPDAAEAGLDPGVVQVRRTGGHLAAALNVFFRKSGTAANGADYQSLGGGLSLVVIPAGQTTTAITIAPVADNLVEGAETAVLTLEPNQAYTIGTTDSATVTIADDPPVVEIVATDADAAEAGLDPGSVTISRRGGNAAQALTVPLARSGTATMGTDYGTVPANVTIPAGAVGTAVPVTPIDDGLVEGDETVVLTVTASGSVVPGPSATAVVVIRDDD